MKRIVVWGLGQEFLYWQKMLESKEMMDKQGRDAESVKIIAYCDRNPERRKYVKELFIEQDKVYDYNPDIVLTSSKIESEVKRSLDKIWSMNGTPKVYNFAQFIKERLNAHEKAVGNGMNMDKYCREILKRTDFRVSSIMEIGANYGQDAEYLRLFWDIDSEHTYTFEANPRISKEIDRRYKYHNYNYAVCDYTGKILLHCVDEEDSNSGLSTVKEYKYADNWEKIEVNCICMRDFLDEHTEIDTIDFLKLDVEGANFEVLKGFGDYLKKVSIIQTEAENLLCGYNGEHYLFNDIARLLMDYEFELISYELGGIQSDSLWIKRDLLKKGSY